MKVKIIKSSGPDFWYKNCIGEVYDVYDEPILHPNSKYDYRLI